MKDERDLLSHVSRTLRERNDGREPADARTRERILASVRKQNKRRNWWIKGSIPGGMLLLGTTAWAQATHQWPAVWRTIGDILSLPLSSEGNSEQELAETRNVPTPTSKLRPSASATSAQAASSSTEDENIAADAGIGAQADETNEVDSLDAPNGDATPSPNEPTSTASSLSGKTRRKKSGVRSDSEPSPAPEPVEQEPVQPSSEPEIAAFRAANDLDIKQHNLGAALSAYRLYVRDYPAGRFVPEARYNAAIILVKLGKRDEARRELTPFASGKYGAHRQARAAKLLEALELGAAPNADPKR